jgi:hypothetical protein
MFSLWNAFFWVLCSQKILFNHLTSIKRYKCVTKKFKEVVYGRFCITFCMIIPKQFQKQFLKQLPHFFSPIPTHQYGYEKTN